MPTSSQDLIAKYRSIFLSHQPQRHAVMCSPGSGKKYDDRPGSVSDALLLKHLLGKQTIAAPAAHGGLSAALPIDVDSHALHAVPALMSAAESAGLYAFGLLYPAADRSAAEQRGYVWICFADLSSSERLQLLGAELVKAAGVESCAIELRCHGADTRLPIAYHRGVCSFGLLLLPGREAVEIDGDPLGAAELLLQDLQLNTAELLPVVAPASAEQVTATRRSAPGVGVVSRFNAEHDLVSLLLAYGARRAGRALYLCPFHPDNNASLAVYQSRDGRTVCHCKSAHSACPLAQHAKNDAFNVWLIGERLSMEQGLAQLREKYGVKLRQQPLQTRKEAKPTSTTATPQNAAQSVTAVNTWRTDPALAEYIKAEGSTGVYMVHKAREKLGEGATARQIQAEIKRRRGSCYDARYLRRLSQKRRELLERWEAVKSLGGEGNLNLPDSHIYVLKASRGGNSPAEQPSQAEPTQAAPIAQAESSQAESIEETIAQAESSQAAPVEVVEGAASYNPAQDWTLTAEQRESLLAELTDRTFRRPPTDPARRSRYYALLGKAKRVEHQHPRQAALLRRQAESMEIVTTSPQLVNAARPASPDPTMPPAAGASPDPTMHAGRVTQTPQRDRHDPRLLINQNCGIKRLARAAIIPAQVLPQVPPPNKP